MIKRWWHNLLNPFSLVILLLLLLFYTLRNDFTNLFHTGQFWFSVELIICAVFGFFMFLFLVQLKRTQAKLRETKRELDKYKAIYDQTKNAMPQKEHNRERL